jgi:hypothetical protein
MSRWWRAEDTSIDHPKLLKLSDAMHRAWYTLMCVASANGGVLPPVGDIAVRLREKPPKVAGWIAYLVAAGLFDNDDGTFRPHNWNKRQYKSDGTDATNADRQKQFRARQRAALNELKALRNGARGALRNGVSNVMAKRPETETDITPTADVERVPSNRSETTELASIIKKRGWA